MTEFSVVIHRVTVLLFVQNVRGGRCHTRVMHAKLLFHVFNTTPKLNLCMFKNGSHSVHVEFRAC